MTRGLFVYLSGPITARHDHTIEQNVAAGVRVFLECVARGIPAFSPHLCAAIPSAWLEVSYDKWIEFDLAILERCSHILMLPRWESSPGALIEKQYAESIDLPVIYAIEEIAPHLLPVRARQHWKDQGDGHA